LRPIKPQILSKRRIALLQLERSIRLLEESNDPVCALTLAGAAEEILGQIATQKGRSTTVENWAEYLGSFYDWMGKPRPPRKKLISVHNRVRNALKHNDAGKNTRVRADFRFEAEDMILRAVKNYFEAFDSLPTSKTIRSWFEQMTL